MVGKNGYLRVAEAVLGILIVLGFLIVLNRNAYEKESDLNLQEKIILDEVAKNETLREKIILDATGVEEEIVFFAKQRLYGRNVNVSAFLCELNESCELEADQKRGTEIYAAERVISTDKAAQNFNPKKIKLFVWKE